MNKFKKKTRSKVIAASIAILSSAAVVSTGFAAWVISGGDSKEATGTITADTVTNSYHTIKPAEGDRITFDKNIIFGGPATIDSTITITNSWLSNNAGTDQKENLVAKASFIVENVHSGEDNLATLIDLKTCRFVDVGNKYANAQKNDENEVLGVLPSWGTETIKVYSAENVKTPGIYLEKGQLNGTNLSITVYVAFGWGDYFNNNNPYYFYNQKPKTSENLKEANTILGDIRAGLDGCSFTITIATN